MATLKPRNSRETETQTQAADTVMVAGSNSAAQNNARNIGLIIGREYRARVQKRSFIIATVIMAVLVIVAAFVPTIIELLTSNNQSKVTIVNNAGPIAGQNDP